MICHCVTKFNDNHDFVKIAIFSHQRNLFCLPWQKRFFMLAEIWYNDPYQTKETEVDHDTFS